MKKWIYKKVLSDLQKIPLFRGIYDAKNGTKEFMQGIYVLIEYICYHADNEEFANEFIDNMIASEDKINV